MRRFVSDARGSAAIVFGLLAPVLFMAAGAAVDYSNLAQSRTRLQAAADAAALAGARQMLNDIGMSAQMQEEAARQNAESYVLSSVSDATRNIQASSSGRRVTVSLAQTKQLYFGGFFGLNQSTISVTAVAAFTPADLACLIALGKMEPIGIEVSGSAEVSAPKCTMWANSGTSSSLQSSGSAKATARIIAAAGGISGTAGFSPSPKANQPAIADPYAGQYIPPPSTACQYSGFAVGGAGGPATMKPGVYCNGVSINGDVTLSAGTYYIYNSVFEVKGSPQITGSGVTIVLVGNSYLDWRANGTVSLSAPTSGQYAGLLIVSDPNGPAQTSTMHGTVTTEVILQGTLNGSIYLPNQQLAMTGNSKILLANTGTKVVAKSVAIAGNAKVTLGSDDYAEAKITTKNLRLIQ
jgi:hypothetical protein